MSAVRQPLLHLENVSKKFPRSVILGLGYKGYDLVARYGGLKSPEVLRRSEIWGIHRATFTLGSDETVGVVGSIGSGKSVLSSLMAGALRPDHGDVIRQADVFAPHWNAVAILHGCGNCSSYEAFTQSLFQRVWAGLSGSQPSSLHFRLFSELMSQNVPEKAWRSGPTASSISLVVYRFVLETFEGVVILDKFMSDLDPDDQQHLASQWSHIAHAARSRVLVFDDPDYASALCDRLVVLQNNQIVHDGPVREGTELYDKIFRLRPDEATKYYPEATVAFGHFGFQQLLIKAAGVLGNESSVRGSEDGEEITFYVDFEAVRRIHDFQVEVQLLHVGSRTLLAIEFDHFEANEPCLLTKGRYRLAWSVSRNCLPAGLLSPVMEFRIGGDCIPVHFHSAAVRVISQGGFPPDGKLHSLTNPVIYPGYTYLSDLEAFCQLQPGSLCIDCGANVGDVTQLMLFHKCKVVAFEPCSAAFAVLSDRFAGIEDVRCIHKGVFDENTQLPLYSPKGVEEDELRSSVSSTLYADKTDTDNDRYELIDLVDIKNVIDELEMPVALMKIDIEGAEYRVLNRLLETGCIHSIGCILVEEHFEKVPSLLVERTEVIEKFRVNKIENVWLNWM